MNKVPPFMYIKEEECCACSACKCICPVQAIAMIPDEEGFLYPNLDREKCCSCNKCITVCPLIVKSKVEKRDRKIYGGYLENQELLLNSASGGAFGALAQVILKANGYICGAIYSKDYKNVYHICSNKKNEIELMRGSKYIQSNKEDVYVEIENILNNGGLVLFSGLPCEVGGLKGYLKKEYNNLITCDLICHGPTSQKINEQYINSLVDKFGVNINNFTVRYKNKGNWTPPYIKAEFENNKTYIAPFYSTSYGMAFSIMKRKSCYSCGFKGDNSKADITLGDYWGMDKNDKDYNVSGVSVLIVNTEKGEELVSKLEEFKIFLGEYEKVVKNNLPLVESTKMSVKRDIFTRLLKEKGLEVAANKGISIKEKIYKLIPSGIYRYIPKWMIRGVKEILNKFSQMY